MAKKVGPDRPATVAELQKATAALSELLSKTKAEFGVEVAKLKVEMSTLKGKKPNGS